MVTRHTELRAACALSTLLEMERVSESHGVLKSTECKAQWEHGAKQQQATKRKHGSYLKVEASAWDGIYSSVVHPLLLHSRKTISSRGLRVQVHVSGDSFGAMVLCSVS